MSTRTRTSRSSTRRSASTGPLPERIPVSGGLADAPADFGTEATLDTQVVRAVAPGAQILVYGFPATTTFGAAMDAIVEDGRAQIVSVSYGKCFAAGYLSLDEYEEATLSLAAAAAAGVSLFAASGDWGAFSCHAFDKTDHQISTFYPALHGQRGQRRRHLPGRPTGRHLPARDRLGGLPHDERHGRGLQPRGPDARLPGRCPGSRRRSRRARPSAMWTRTGVGGVPVPDIAASADSDTGYLLFFTDPETGVGGLEDGRWHERRGAHVGGRHGARPAEGPGGRQPSAWGSSRRPLYQLAASHPEVFHDVTRGGNLVDAAHAGWDAATGLGSPDVGLLADVIEIAGVHRRSDGCAGAS